MVDWIIKSMVVACLLLWGAELWIGSSKVAERNLSLASVMVVAGGLLTTGAVRLIFWWTRNE